MTHGDSETRAQAIIALDIGLAPQGQRLRRVELQAASRLAID